MRTSTRGLMNLLILSFTCALLFSVGNGVALAVDLNSDVDSTGVPGSVLNLLDTDKDGITDVIEEDLGTDINNRTGDIDGDGLYDFEEYLDLYGTPNNMGDTPKYDYNNSMTHRGVLDIYHKFNLSSNKTGYIRDNSNYNTQSVGFTDYLLWNITFSGSYAGGNSAGSVLYQDNLIINVSFFGSYAGGSNTYRVEYRNNVIKDTKWTGNYAGGSATGDVIYQNNFLENVNFSGYATGATEDKGGSDYNGFDTTYFNNSLINAEFTGEFAGGSDLGAVKYENNFIQNSRFRSNGFLGSSIVYKNNRMLGVSFYDSRAGEFESTNDFGIVKYEGNILKDVTFSGINAGGAVGETAVSYLGNNLTNVLFSGKDAGLSEEGITTYMHNLLTNVSYSGITDAYGGSTFVLANNSIIDDDYDSDNDGLDDLRELFVLGTNPASMDTDRDRLPDGWELRYNGTSGINPVVTANVDELSSDLDDDGLTLLQEFQANTDPTSNDSDNDGLTDGSEVLIFKTNSSLNDTDSDGLADGWEAAYTGASGVNPLDTATVNELNSDFDGDGLTLLQEEKANSDPLSEDTDNDGLNDSSEVLTFMTDPTLNDTDGDGLADGWEVRYTSISGVDPLLAATTSELASDIDNDGLNLIEELKANTNPLLNDTDGDGLADGWEVAYSGAFGVNPLLAATASELASDTDNDGLTLLEEAKTNTDPETVDNPVKTNTTMDNTNTTTFDLSLDQISVLSSFTLLAALVIFTSFSLTLVFYRVRRRML